MTDYPRKCAAGCGGYSGKNKFCGTKQCVENRKYCYDCGVNERGSRSYRCGPCQDRFRQESVAASHAKTKLERETAAAAASRNGAASSPLRPPRPEPVLSPSQRQCPHCGGFRVWERVDAELKCMNCGRRTGLRLAG